MTPPKEQPERDATKRVLLREVRLGPEHLTEAGLLACGVAPDMPPPEEVVLWAVLGTPEGAKEQVVRKHVDKPGTYRAPSLRSWTRPWSWWSPRLRRCSSRSATSRPRLSGPRGHKGVTTHRPAPRTLTPPGCGLKAA